VSVLVTGATGILGHAICRSLAHREPVIGVGLLHSIAVAGVTLVRADLSNRGSIETLVHQAKPHLIIHCAALTDVDRCEREPILAERVNVAGTSNVAAAARAAGASLVHISTDQLWDGSRPFVTEETPPCPLNVYGRTKAEAEAVALSNHRETLVVRTNFFGAGLPWRRSFSDWVVDGLAAGASLRLFTDVFFTPISIPELVGSLLELVSLKVTGVIHLAGSERVSKYEFGCAIARALGYDSTRIVPCSVGEANLQALRPREMSLGILRAETLLGRRLPDLSTGLADLHLASRSSSV